MWLPCYQFDILGQYVYSIIPNWYLEFAVLQFSFNIYQYTYITTTWPAVNKWGHLQIITKFVFLQVYSLTYQTKFPIFTSKLLQQAKRLYEGRLGLRHNLLQFFYCSTYNRVKSLLLKNYKRAVRLHIQIYIMLAALLAFVTGQQVVNWQQYVTGHLLLL